MTLEEGLGTKKTLMVVKEVEFGVYLGNSQEKVLLPKKQVPEGVEVGDPIEVFLYKDSSDRLIATTNEPKIMLGELAVLTVAATGGIGAFLDWGLEKDLLLPFREQTAPLKKGDQIIRTNAQFRISRPFSAINSLFSEYCSAAKTASSANSKYASLSLKSFSLSPPERTA